MIDRSILAVTTDRADAAPLTPVVQALRDRNVHVSTLDLSRKDLRGCFSACENLMGGSDIVLMLGDRIELLPAATAAQMRGIPIAHIHGGERTLGSYDDHTRDAITKLSHVHFVATDKFRDRLVNELGEPGSRVYVTGAPGLDNAQRVYDETQPRFMDDKYFLLTFHPETLSQESSIKPLMDALEEFPDYKIVWTGVNRDPGWNEVMEEILIRRKIQPTTFINYDGYLAAAKHADLLIGNSSSHIIEGPILRTPSVDVGDRQKGRPMGSSVFHAEPHSRGITEAIRAALDYSGDYDSPYGGAGASAKIADKLIELDLNGILVKE